MKQSITLAAFILFMFFTKSCFGQNTELDSLLITLKKLDKQIVIEDDFLVNFLEGVWKLQEYKTKVKVDNILQEINPAIIENSNERVQFLFELIRGRNSVHKHNYQNATKSIEEAKRLKDYGKSQELIYLNMTGAIVSYYIADYVKALEYDFEALEICNKETDKSCLTDIYNNISVIHLMTNNLEKCEEYGLKAYDIADSLNYTIAKSRATQNLAIVFTEKKEYKKAEKWHLEDLKIQKTLGDSLSILRTYNNLGVLYEKQDEFKKAQSYYKYALNLAQLINDDSSVALGYQNLAWTNFKNGNHRRAEELFELAINDSKDLRNRNLLRDNYKNISEFYRSTDRPKAALDYQSKYIILNDSIVGEDHLNAISELEIKYETQKKENELLKLSKQKQENDLVIARQNRKVQQLSFGLGALVLFSVLGFFLFKQRLQNKKQEELLMAISETQTEERKRIAQDLHDSIGGSLALTKTKFEAAKSKLSTPSKELESALKTLDQTTHQVRQISHNLMPGELVRFGLVAAINTLLENLNQEEINAQFHTNQKEGRLEPIKEIQLYRIVQEALQNVLKHAKAKNLFIQLNKHKDHLSLMIEDDGKGLDNKESEGMGLKNIKQRVQLLKGIFTVDSSPERGTVLNIQIPA